MYRQNVYKTAFLECTWNIIRMEKLFWRKFDGPEKENLQAQYSFFLHGFISVMAESQVISPDANLGFDDDTLKGKYTQHFNLKYMYKES